MRGRLKIDNASHVLKGNDSRLVHLDGLRGFAAIGVMLFHVQGVFGLRLGFGRAYLFVDVFFMLSGFVLARAWRTTAAYAGDGRDLMVARLARLWPTVAAAALLGAVVHAALGFTDHLPLLLVLSFLIIPAVWQTGVLFPLNVPQWSIFWELLANLAHVTWLRSMDYRILVTFNLITGFATVASIHFYGSNAFGSEGTFWWLAFPRVGWSYSVGMIIARLYETLRSRSIVGPWRALSAFVVTVILIPWVPLSTWLGDSLFVIVAAPALMWLLVTANIPMRRIGHLKRLGEMSYPLYAVHVPIIALSAAAPISPSFAVILAILGSVCLSVASSYLPKGKFALKTTAKINSRLPN